MKLLTITALSLLFIASSLHTSEKNDILTPRSDKEGKERKYEQCRLNLLKLAQDSLFASPNFGLTRFSPLSSKNTDTEPKSGIRPTIVGSGVTMTKKLSFPEHWAISGIRANGTLGTLKIRTGHSDRVLVHGESNIVPYLLISVQQHDLVIKQDYKTKFLPKEPCIVTIQLCPASLALLTSIRTTMTTHVGCPLNLKKLLISMNGDNSFIANSAITTEGECLVTHMGTGTMSFKKIDASTLTIDKSSSGKLSIMGGSIGSGTISMHAGSVDAGKLTINNTLILKLFANARLLCTARGQVKGVLSDGSSFLHFGGGDTTNLQILQPAQYLKVTHHST